MAHLLKNLEMFHLFQRKVIKLLWTAPCKETLIQKCVIFSNIELNLYIGEVMFLQFIDRQNAICKIILWTHWTHGCNRIVMTHTSLLNNSTKVCKCIFRADQNLYVVRMIGLEKHFLFYHVLKPVKNNGTKKRHKAVCLNNDSKFIFIYSFPIRPKYFRCKLMKTPDN